jgi:hypothetical protein
MRVAIVGAGAIGAGFLYPVLNPHFEVDVYDVEIRARKYQRRVIGRKGATSHRFLQKHVNALGANAESQPYDFVFVTVGCSRFLDVVGYLSCLTAGIIVCCDNMYNPAGYAREQLPSSSCNFVNGYPWVSCFPDTKGYLCEDGYFSVGEFAYDEGLSVVPEILPYLDDHDEWETRLLVHCGPHAVVAYNGWADGCETIPEAVRARDYDVLWSALSKQLPESDGLIQRERALFEDTRFPDPVLRVARNPHRKLWAKERLPRLYRRVAHVDKNARWIVRDSILNAIRFGRKHDPVVMQARQLVDEDTFAHYYCGLRGVW